MSTSGGHAPYGCRHVVPSAIPLACMYASLAKPVLAGVCALPAPTGQRSRLSANIGRKLSKSALFVRLQKKPYLFVTNAILFFDCNGDAPTNFK